MLRGTLTTFRRRCGKPNCRCADGDAHESPALTYTESGRTKTMTLAPEEIDDVAAAIERYQAAQGELDDAAAAGLARFRSSRTARAGRAGAGGRP
jgi:hypothetical protein